MTLAPVPPVVLASGRRVAHLRWSTVADGDFHLESHPVALAQRQQAFSAGPWTHLDEVHGIAVVEVRRPGEHDRACADGAVSRRAGVVLSVWTADCAPVTLVGDDGVVAVAHAGWRGADAGVLQATVSAMRTGAVRAVLGPCIRRCCNEFGEDLLAALSARHGDGVVGRTTWGAPSLDLPALVRLALGGAGVALLDVPGLDVCTRCDPRFWSHRRGDRARQVATVRMMEAA